MRTGIDDFYTSRETVDALMNHFPTPGIYFDMSAGDGYVAKKLVERGWTIAGQVDVAPRGDHITKGSFLDISPQQVTLVGFNPPFGRQAALAKQFLQHVAQVWNPTYIAIILPRSLRGTTRVVNYVTRVKEDVDAFYRPETMRKKRVKTTFWLLERIEGEEAILSKAPKIDIRVPSGVILYPRSKRLDPSINVILRVQGGYAGRDAIVFEDDTWHVMKAGKWSHTLQDVADAPWSINKRRQGADFALLKIERGRLRECIDYISTNLDPREYVVPSMSRTWLCTCLRVFYHR